MLSILRLFSRVATVPKMVAQIPKVAIPAMTNPSGQNAIDAATRVNARTFAAYMFVLLITALAVALFTYLTWRSSNGVQDAIVADANARIEEAKSSAAVAIRAAGEANERSKRLEHANLVLSGQVALQKEKTANAQKDLLELQSRLAWRTIGKAVHEAAVQSLLPYRGASVAVISSGGIDEEMHGIINALLSIFNEAKWDATFSKVVVYSGAVGTSCTVDPRTRAGQALLNVCSAIPSATVHTGELKGIIGQIVIASRSTP